MHITVSAGRYLMPTVTGACNAVLNLCIIALASSTLSPNLIYPVLGAGKLAVVGVFSIFLFKEKMRWWQWCGIGSGALAIILLSL